jgi:hypothetical protein
VPHDQRFEALLGGVGGGHGGLGEILAGILQQSS